MPLQGVQTIYQMRAAMQLAYQNSLRNMYGLTGRPEGVPKDLQDDTAFCKAINTLSRLAIKRK